MTNAATTKTTRTQAFVVNIAYLLKVNGQIACELTRHYQILETDRDLLTPGPIT
jgi:hypothetical protein